jgi:hypothetical protein
MWLRAWFVGSPVFSSLRRRWYVATSAKSGKYSVSSGGTGALPWSRSSVVMPDCWATIASTEPNSRTGVARWTSGSMNVPRRRCRVIRPSSSSSFSACRMVSTLTP